jgi:leucyl aminopeptidase
MPVSFSLRADDPSALDTPLLVVLLPKPTGVPAELHALDEALGGSLERTLARRDFRGGRDEVLHLGGGASGPQRIVLVGIASADDRSAVRRAASLAGRQAAKYGVAGCAVVAPGLAPDLLEVVATGIALGAWDYDELKTPPPAEERKPKLEQVTVLSGSGDEAREAVARGESIGMGYALARRLAQMPGNLCTPDYLAETAREIGARHSIHVSVLGREELAAEKMGAFLAVAQGTPLEPRLIALEYRGGATGAKPLVLVGKGLCFDTGGISIKPAERMEYMKFDMCGAAGVLGAMEAIARLELPLNVVGLVGSTTNMPSGTAYKPGDVIVASNGKSIEVVNTDAEGRMVLADVLVYAKRYDPAAVIDAATLTGACVIALGHNATGVFGTDDALVQEVLAAAKRASEPGWPMPLWEEYKEQIKSDVADIKQTGGRAAGSITAAMILREFAEGYPWVHLDVAGTAYSESDLVAIPRGPTGTPVGTFVELARGRAS